MKKVGFLIGKLLNDDLIRNFYSKQISVNISSHKLYKLFCLYLKNSL